MSDDELPRGLYEELIGRELGHRLDEAARAGVEIERERVDPGEVHERVAHHLAGAPSHVIAAAPADDRAGFARRLVRDVLDTASRHLDEPEALDPLADEMEMLLSVTDRTAFGHAPPRPHVPLAPADHDLLVMGRDEPAVGAELRRELPSADAADLLCAFIAWPGFRVLAEPLEALSARGGRPNLAGVGAGAAIPRHHRAARPRAAVRP
jgi:hypothetical protein